MIAPLLMLLGLGYLLYPKKVENKQFRLKNPLEVMRITSGFGWRNHPILGRRKHHNGLDLGAKKGTPIFAAGDGVVTFAGWSSGYGWHTRILHPGGIETRYGHQSKLLITKGQTVKAGQRIWLVGSTGMSTGPHLHFEIRINRNPVDPKKYL